MIGISHFQFVCRRGFLLPRGVARRVLAVAAAVACFGAARGEETLFTAVEATPEEVGLALARATATFSSQAGPLRSHLRPDPFALVALPCRTAEREALLAVLATKHEFAHFPRQREFAAMLLEGWGRPHEALALLEDESNGIDPLHLTRLRYRVGDLVGA
ncbi:MAG: hypothetical protein MUF04_05825, partial [Akkermansiaceae bacterium]|nr:hypothetical protein [Akkermansiaceae bacterium]